MTTPKGESQYIYGLHDAGGEQLLIYNGQPRGWILITEAIRATPHEMHGSYHNYQEIANNGFGLVVRLNYDYGPEGTIPRQEEYDNFATRASNFIRSSPGCHIWIIGNEMNFEREQPRKRGSNEAEVITPRRYAECFKKVRHAIRGVAGHQNDQVIVGAIGPWNAQTSYDADPHGAYSANKIPNAPGSYPYFGFFGDFIKYLTDILLAIGPNDLDGIAIHAYSHGYDANLVFSDDKMGPPFQKYCYHFRTYRDQMNAIPQQFRHLPVYLTEANGDTNPDGTKWPDVNSGWIKNAYQEINNWNQADNQQIRCVLIYRWIDHDDWSIMHKGQVHQDLRDAVAYGYTWNPIVRPAPIKIPTVKVTIENISAMLPKHPTTTPYQSRDISAIKRLILYHSVSGATITPKALANYHVNSRNFAGIRYHYCVTNEGKVYQTQPLMIVSPHAGSYSQESIIICLIGNFSDNPPPTKQLGGTASLLAYLRSELHLGEGSVFAYRELSHVASPGDTWTEWRTSLLNKVNDLLKEGVPVTAPAPSLSPPSRPVGGGVIVHDIIHTLPTNSSNPSYLRRNRRAIKRIIIHHTATSSMTTIERIAQYQVTNRGVYGITYHYCVMADGHIFQTEPLESVSLHAADFSQDSVGVALIGNFTQQLPPQKQMRATAQLIAMLSAQLNILISDENVIGCREVIRTSSPGNTWLNWKHIILHQARNFVK
ncbi:MAG: hypothetical protein B6242_02480 [Anaerolineaceae bacterium 4572_78]|nr:MAG: hypothetical protein B6242_02480 [Anaerolineaceae bacterium 4572_78]